MNKIKLNGQEYDCLIKYKKIKSMTVRVIGGRLEVSVPNQTLLADIESFLIKNQNKLINALESFEPYYDLKDNGFIILFGKKYSIKVRDLGKNECYFHGHYLYIYTKNIKKAVNDYLSSLLFDYIGNRIDEYLLKDFHFNKPQIIIKYYKSRWGSCYYNENKVSFNSTLVHLRKEIIDSVIIHELCHFIVSDHSKSFYQEVYQRMPDYDIRHAYLKGKNI